MTIKQQNARLKESIKELSGHLEHAITCLAYCRKNHEDSQAGTGIPVEIFYQSAIEKAKVLL